MRKLLSLKVPWKALESTAGASGCRGSTTRGESARHSSASVRTSAAPWRFCSWHFSTPPLKISGMAWRPVVQTAGCLSWWCFCGAKAGPKCVHLWRKHPSHAYLQAKVSHLKGSPCWARSKILGTFGSICSMSISIGIHVQCALHSQRTGRSISQQHRPFRNRNNRKSRAWEPVVMAGAGMVIVAVLEPQKRPSSIPVPLHLLSQIRTLRTFKHVLTIPKSTSASHELSQTRSQTICCRCEVPNSLIPGF